MSGDLTMSTTMTVSQLWLTHGPIIVSSLASCVLAFAAWRTCRKNSIQIQELHVIVNDRLTQLLKLTESSARAEGVKDEKQRVVDVEQKRIEDLDPKN